jgi:hypothetical protein
VNSEKRAERAVATRSPTQVSRRSRRESTAAGGDISFVPAFQRVSGTALDGVWRGQFRIYGGTRGTWALSLAVTDDEDQVRNDEWYDAEELAAVGLSRVPSRVTAPPATPPQNLRGRTVERAPTWPYPIGSTWMRTVTWDPPGTPVPSNAVLVSASAACGERYGEPTVGGLSFMNAVIFLPCTVQVRFANGAGSSPATTFTFW